MVPGFVQGSVLSQPWQAIVMTSPHEKHDIGGGCSAHSLKEPLIPCLQTARSTLRALGHLAVGAWALRAKRLCWARVVAKGQGQMCSGGSGRSSFRSCCRTHLLFHPLLEVTVPWQGWQKGGWVLQWDQMAVLLCSCRAALRAVVCSCVALSLEAATEILTVRSTFWW